MGNTYNTLLKTMQLFARTVHFYANKNKIDSQELIENSDKYLEETDMDVLKEVISTAKNQLGDDMYFFIAGQVHIQQYMLDKNLGCIEALELFKTEIGLNK